MSSELILLWLFVQAVTFFIGFIAGRYRHLSIADKRRRSMQP
ncbi:hypothetical protein [Luteitalea sp.]